MRTTHPLLLAAFLSAACGGQMGGGSAYPGDPLFRYAGRVSGTAPMAAPELHFVWQGQLPPSMDAMTLAFESSTDRSQASETTYTFAVDLYWPPTGAFLQLQEGEPAFARGNAIAIPQGWDLDAISALPGSGLAYGADVSHWVLYFNSDVQAGSLTEWWLSGARPAARRHYLAAVTAAPCLDAGALAACVADLRGRGVPTDPAAEGFCLAPYRLALVDPGEPSLITLGTYEVPTPTCP